MTNKSDGSERRLDFGHFVDRLFWFLLTGAGIYCASSMRELGHSVEQLNNNMAIVLYQLTENKEWKKATDGRLDKIESRQHR